MAWIGTQRTHDVEIMDDLNCAGEVVDQTLRELEIINRLLGGNGVTLDGIAQLAALASAKNITIADLGCGGGDILKLVSTWGQKNDIELTLLGIDANPNIISFAIKNTGQLRNIQYAATNVLSSEFRTQRFDVMLATLFMHHFSDDQLVDILSVMKTQSRIGIVINDIHRHWFAYYSIRLLTRLFSKSAMVRFDAPLSVLRAFKRRELESLLKRAAIQNYSLKWRWAFRWQLIIPTLQPNQHP